MLKPMTEPEVWELQNKLDQIQGLIGNFFPEGETLEITGEELLGMVSLGFLVLQLTGRKGAGLVYLDGGVRKCAYCLNEQRAKEQEGTYIWPDFEHDSDCEISKGRELLTGLDSVIRTLSGGSNGESKS